MIQDYNQPVPQNPNQLQYNTINPNAMSNVAAIQSLSGNPMPQAQPQVPTAMSTAVPVQTQPQVPTAMYAAVPVQAPVGVATNTMPNQNLQTY